MGLADLDVFFDARRAADGNLGTVDAIQPTIEGDCLTVDGPAFGVISPTALRSGWGTDSNVDMFGGASTVEVEVDLAEPFDIARHSQMSSSCYVLGQFGGSPTVDRVIVARVQADGDMFVYVADGTNTESLIAATNPIPDGSRVLRWEWNGPTGTFTAKTSDTIGGTLTTLGTASGGAVSALPTGAVEPLGVCSRSANGHDPFPFFLSRVRAWADGVLVFDLRGDDFDNADDTTVTPTVGPELTRRAGEGNTADASWIIPAGQAVVVNPDHTESGNRISTGQGIVKSAAAETRDAAAFLSVPHTSDADGFAILMHVDYPSPPPAFTPLINAGGGFPSFYVDVTTAGSFRTLGSNDGVAYQLVATSSVAPMTSGRTTGFLRVTYDASTGVIDVEFSEGDSDHTPSYVSLLSVATTTGATRAITESLRIGQFPGCVFSRVAVGPTHDAYVLDLTAADLARGAEGESSFPASTGQTVTAYGNVGWNVLEWGGVEPTATFDGVSGSYESVPDEAAFNITGDLCIVAKVALDDWTPAAINGIASKWESSGSEKSYGLAALSGSLRLYYSPDGAATNSVSSSVFGFTDGTARWVAVTVDVDNGASGFDAKFWDGGAGDTPSWSQFGSTVTTAGAISFFDSSTPLHIGDIDGSLPLAGAVEYAAVYDGIGDHSAPGLGTKVFERTQADLARAASAGVGDGDTYESASGHTVTSHGGVTYTGEAPLVIGADESAVLGGTFIIGNQTGGFPWAARIGGEANIAAKLGFFRRDASDTMNAQAEQADGTGGQSAVLTFDPTEFAAYFVAVDRDADLLRNLIVHADGTVDESTVDISGVGAIAVTEGITALQSLPGAVGSFVFDKIDTYTEAEVVGWATSLLTAYTAPATPPTLNIAGTDRKLILT